VPSKQARLDLDWAADLELLASALESGLLVPSCLHLLSTRASDSWRNHFEYVAKKLESESTLHVALTEFKIQASDSRFDFLIELLLAHVQFGGRGLVDALNRAAQDHRNRANVRDDVASRLSAIVSVARLGAASPWVMLALLCTRSENFVSYTTGLGPSILVFGFIVCASAMIMINRMSRLPNYSRGLGA
jgi:tight adherence protein B